jgi:hypothetical protein
MKRRQGSGVRGQQASERFGTVSGHDFSRAASGAESTRALAPEEMQGVDMDLIRSSFDASWFFEARSL